MEIGKAVSDLKAGKVEYRVDRAGNIHSIVGKSSFPVANLVENAKVLIDAIVRARPATAKGQYVKRIALSTTMGPGVHVDHTKMAAEVKH
jgi:large subunit ribosomal protein L1